MGKGERERKRGSMQPERANKELLFLFQTHSLPSWHNHTHWSTNGPTFCSLPPLISASSSSSFPSDTIGDFRAGSQEGQ